MKRTLGLLMLLALSVLVGCSAPATYASSSRVSVQHVIFNPECTGIPPFGFARIDWPSTVAFSHVGEEIDYKETILDWQGRFGGDLDQTYYRRFASVRTGRARR